MNQIITVLSVFLIGLSFASPTSKEALQYLVMQAEELGATTEAFLHAQRRLGHEGFLKELEKESINLELLVDQLKSRAALPNFENESVLYETQQLEIQLLTLENVILKEIESVQREIEEGRTQATTQQTTIAPTTKPHTAAPTTKPPTTLSPTAAPTTKPPTTLSPTAAPTTKPPTVCPPTKPPTAAPTIDSIIEEARKVVALANEFLKHYTGLERHRIITDVIAIGSLIDRYHSNPNPVLLARMESLVRILKSILRRHGIHD